MDNKKIGLVTKAAGSLYTVRDKLSGEACECKIRGKLRLNDGRTTNPLSVGDVVCYEAGAAPVVTALLPRRNYIIRRAANLSKEAHIVAANIDQAFLVVTVDFPRTSMEFIDRFLISAEAYKIPVSLVINKMDLYDEERLQEAAHLAETYSAIGYQTLKISIKVKDDINLIKSLLYNKITLFSGNSGVGKSSLINALNPQLNLRVGEISEFHNKGKHTTTFSEMLEVEAGSYVVDTPGIKGFGLVDINPNELSHYFKEIFAASRTCKFNGCTHVHEPGCAVRQAVESGSVSQSRYISYLKMLEGDEKYRR
ncbi:MAG: ribosome small subunit-dependent GTPase A [Prevotellaceae bacterium]|jgi:ribosome biogenesis GTPase|nr:ribosome small subunit-dependent GTPase A [Prevotellaceae bacterium]